jgi:hypothetical protein
MRFSFPVLALLLAGISIFVESAGAPPAAPFCIYGLCRFDQIYSSIDEQGIDLANQGALLNLDPSNPLAWCVYGELLAAAGRKQEAHGVFLRAISLGPAIAPVLVRAANFDFAHGYAGEGLALSHQILDQTPAYDDVIFSYLTRDARPISQFLGTAVPAKMRTARAWIGWLERQGSDQDLLTTWQWMQEQRLCSASAAAQMAGILWDRKLYRIAQALWADSPGTGQDGYPRLQLVANRFFKKAPDGGPFDWTLPASGPSARIVQENGLEIQFPGKENTNFSGVHEFTAAPPGRYRFSAEIQAAGLSTDQGLYFHIFNPSGGGVNVQTQQIKGDVERSWIHLNFQVPTGSDAMEIQIERQPSQKFDNKLAGTLHVYQVSVVPVL